MEIALAVLVVLILILVGFGLMGRRMLGYYSEHAIWRFPRALVSSTEFKPGDILLFTGHTHGFVNSLLTQDFYTHGSIIVRNPKDGQCYISETMIGDEVMPHPQKSDVELVAGGKTVILPLYSRIKFYPGETFLMRLTPELSPAQSNKLWELAHANTPYPGFWNSFLRIVGLEKLLSNRGTDERHCMAHVAWMLDQIGLTPTKTLKKGKKMYRGSFLGTCRRVSRIYKEPLGVRGTCHYLPPVHLLYDLDAVTIPA